MTGLIAYKRYDDDDAFYAVNYADRHGDGVDDNPAIRELQEASRTGILTAIHQPANVPVKVAMVGPARSTVRGYVTLERFLLGATVEQFEGMLGFKQGALSRGCHVYYFDLSALAPEDIGPRFLTSWSAGVSPRDLFNLSQTAGEVVRYHRDYPAASDPIPQFVIYKPVTVRNLRVLRPGDRFDNS